MKPVDQTTFHVPGVSRGDCYRACIASLLELTPEQVPHFIEREDWLQATKEFLTLHGLDVIIFRPGEDGILTFPDCFHVMSGMGPRGVRHAVVALRGQMVHDPHPSREGLLSVDEFDFLVPLAPGHATLLATFQTPEVP